MNSETTRPPHVRNVRDLYVFEQALQGPRWYSIAGVDEAGRGPLAGPVVAAAVVFPEGTQIAGVDDSKRLAPSRREELIVAIQATALAWGVGYAEPHEIDEVNILNATFRAMHRAVACLGMRPELLLVDGNMFPESDIPAMTVVGGDARCFSVAAASIVAKVTRDRLMAQYDRLYPAYGFARHKGYGTREHCDAIQRFGPCPIHRRSFLGRFAAEAMV